MDDSLQEKLWTDGNELVCWHFDHSKQRSIKGVNFMSSLLVCDDVSIPVGVEFVKKDLWATNAKTGKPQRKNSNNKINCLGRW